MAEETQVLVKFITKLPAHLRVPETPVAVPSDLKRYGLSQIINHLLALDPPRPFDFLIDGELVRKSLEQHLLAHNLSAESTLEVEYVPAVVPPQQKNSTPHDDWVSSVDGSRCAPASSSGGSPSGVVVSGSYDGLLRLWNGDLEAVASVSAHAGGVNCVRFLPKSQGDLLLTSGKDRLVKMWHLESSSEEEDAGPSCRLVATYRGHEDGVEAVAASPSGRRFASCGWDGKLLVWEGGRAVAEAAEADEAAGTAEASKKKRKTGTANGSAAAGAGGLTIAEPSADLRGHLHCVSSVAWPAENSLFSGGWDHSVRRWDVSSGAAADTYNGSKAVLCIASHAASPALVAFGCSDRALRLWDTRGKAGSDALAVTTQGAHGGWVTAVAWCPSSQHHIASASHDGTIKMWDIRTQIPLGTLSHHTDKVLALGWLGGAEAGHARGLVSGGADCQLRMYESDYIVS